MLESYYQFSEGMAQETWCLVCRNPSIRQLHPRITQSAQS